MLGWLRSLLRRKRFSRRGLFPFYDPATGQRRFADPLKTYRAIFHHPGFDQERHLSLVQLGEEPETSELIQIIAEAFGIERFDGTQGWMDREVLALLYDFLDYVQAQKKSIEKPPTSQRPTALNSSTAHPPETTNCT